MSGQRAPAKWFDVLVPEVWYQRIRVTGVKTPEEAIAIVEEGDGEYLEMEYSHPLDGDEVTWMVEDEKGETVEEASGMGQLPGRQEGDGA